MQQAIGVDAVTNQGEANATDSMHRSLRIAIEQKMQGVILWAASACDSTQHAVCRCETLAAALICWLADTRAVVSDLQAENDQS